MASELSSKQHSVKEILSLVDRRVTVVENGGLQANLNLETLFRIVATLHSFNEKFTASERIELVREAMIAQLKKGRGQLTEHTFKDGLSKLCSRRLQLDTQAYSFRGWIARSGAAFPKVMTWRTTKLRLRDDDPASGLAEEDHRKLSEILKRVPQSKFVRVEFLVEARSFDHAAEVGEKLFNEWRGCVDFICSFRKAHWLFDGVPTPLSEIPAHPIFTISLKGECRSWYSIRDAISFGKLVEKDALKRVGKQIAWVQRRVKRYVEGDADRIYLAFQSYCSAVDCSDYELSLQRMWTTLEILTGSDKSEEVIRCVASLYRTTDFSRELLTYFSESRNQLAHAARASNIDRVLIDSLRVNVHRVFQEILINDHQARRIEEVFDATKLAASDSQVRVAAMTLRRAMAERKRRAAAD